MKRVIYISLLLILVSVAHNVARAQEWRKLVPLVSTCEDVKNIFKIKTCEFPYMTYETSAYKAQIEFSKDNFGNECAPNNSFRNISKETVLSVSIRLNEGIALKDFEPDLSGYKIEQDGDLADFFRYKNKKTGIEFVAVHTEDAENSIGIGSITLNPSEENDAKFKCPLQWKEIKPFVSKCNDLKRIFKIEKCTFPTTAIKTSRFELTVNFAKNVCGKKCNPRTDCWKVSNDTVLSISVVSPFSYDNVSLEDFAPDWENYVKESVPYYPDSLRYTYPEKGIELETYGYYRTISKLRLFPSLEDEKKYRCGKLNKLKK